MGADKLELWPTLVRWICRQLEVSPLLVNDKAVLYFTEVLLSMDYNLMNAIICTVVNYKNMYMYLLIAHTVNHHFKSAINFE